MRRVIRDALEQGYKLLERSNLSANEKNSLDQMFKCALGAHDSIIFCEKENVDELSYMISHYRGDRLSPHQRAQIDYVLDGVKRKEGNYMINVKDFLTKDQILRLECAEITNGNVGEAMDLYEFVTKHEKIKAS